MGAWGSGSFENDSALDWVDELVDGDSAAPIREAFDNATGEEEYLDVDVGSAALAAGEVVAALLGKPCSDLSPELTEWIEEHHGEGTRELAAKALTAIDAVLGENSELKELWDESGESEAWLAGVNDLKGRLANA